MTPAAMKRPLTNTRNEAATRHWLDVLNSASSSNRHQASLTRSYTNHVIFIVTGAN